ncbi:alpha/beta hydrolase [Flavobacterium sp.]|uniref:alpha/beta hydrolase n=1 Tax=Flavobacterium sp. TaxID=239 RepID=UPI0026034936|nr:alpha/beta hydrolase [Flavobacterium sp.]
MKTRNQEHTALKKIGLFLLLGFAIQQAFAQELYSKAYGNPKDTPVVFLHGGPGYNAAGFEVSTAQNLADNGFYVVVYDRRGEGRSTDPKAKFTFEETFCDINAVLNEYQLKKATLIGHSFGGIVATLFASQYPEKVNAIELVSAPVSLQETFKTILNSSLKIYEKNNDQTNLNYIGMIEKMDTTSVEYYAYCFGHAMQNGFYSPKKMSNQAKEIYAISAKNPNFEYVSKMTTDPPQAFLKNENYTSINLTKNLQALMADKTKIFALYGKDDGLYSPEQVNQLAAIIGDKNLKYLDDCSHNVFIDQQSMFIDFLKATLK